MRFLFVIALIAGCQSATAPAMIGEGGDMNPGSGGGGAVPGECAVDADCVLAGVKCCDCPSYAVPKTDPSHSACTGVTCPTMTCPANVRAACESGACVLACVPMTCNQSCANGYATDASGCLTCACAVVDARECTGDSDCARVRADCCGCAMGGMDTAVPVADVASHDAALMCPSHPSCPQGTTCAPDQSAQCIAGACELAGPLPANACGRPDLPACATCTVNRDPAATAHGVGVCL